MKKHIEWLIFALTCTVLISIRSNAQKLTLSPGTFFTNNGSVTMLNTDVQNNGSITGTTSVFVFSGNIDNTISGNGTTTFHHLQLSKQGSAKLVLQKNLTATGAVIFNSGLIDLGNYQLELKYPGGVLQNETETNRIISNGTGEVFITQTLNAPNNIKPGNLGVTITSQNNLGVTTIRRGHKAQTNNAQQQSMQRYFQIAPTNNSGIEAALRFSYFETELNNVPETNYGLFEKTGASDWKLLQADGISMLYNYREKFGLTSLNSYTMFSSVQGALPLTLLAFDVSCKDGNARLQWITANEVNTKQFTIEKSSDGSSWQPASVVPSRGNTSQETYSELVPSTASFFRLKMEDMDGKFTYSPVRKIDCNSSEKIIVGPNPTKGNVTISVTTNTSKLLTISVVDMAGRIIFSRAWAVKQGLNSEVIDLYKHSASTYIIMVKGEHVNELVKIIKQ